MRVVLSFFVVLLFVVGCGGGGGNETPGERQLTVRTAIGQFKDANVEGLSYVSGGQSGITDSEGRFTYEVGETVMFSVGGVTLGETESKSLVTPVDLVEQGSSSSEPVLNTVRFLISLDEDNDLSNGINIPEEVRELARQWTFIEILSDSLDFEQQLERMRSNLQERFSRYESYEIPKNTTQGTIWKVLLGVPIRVDTLEHMGVLIKVILEFWLMHVVEMRPALLTALSMIIISHLQAQDPSAMIRMPHSQVEIQMKEQNQWPVYFHEHDSRPMGGIHLTQVLVVVSPARGSAVINMQCTVLPELGELIVLTSMESSLLILMIRVG